MRRTTRWAPLAMALLFLAVPAPAAQEGDLFSVLPQYSGDIEDLAWEAQELSGGDPTRSFGRTLGADLTVYHGPDAIAELGGELVLITAPGRFQFFHPSGIYAYDFDVHPAAGPAGRDAVVYVDDVAGWLATYDVTQHAWGSTLLSSAWGAGRAIRSDGESIVALSSDGMTLHWWREDTPSSRTLPDKCKTLELLDYDGDAEPELLLLHQTGVTVAEIEDGTVLFDWRFAGMPHDRDQIAVLPAGDDPSGKDLAVYLSEPLSDGNQWVSIAESDLGFVEFIGLGAIDVAGMAAAAVDSGNYYDLLFTAKVDHGILAALNQRSSANPTAPRFGGLVNMLIYVYESTASPQFNQVKPACADWDSDGDPELLYLSAGEDRYVMFEDLQSPTSEALPAVTSTAVDWNAPNSTLDFTLDVSQFGSAVDVNVEVYQAPSEGAYIDIDPFSVQAFTASEGSVFVQASLPSILADGFIDIFYIAIQVEDPGGVPQHEIFGIWAFDEAAALRLQSAPGPALEVWKVNPEDDPTQGGSFVPGRRGGSGG